MSSHTRSNLITKFRFYHQNIVCNTKLLAAHSLGWLELGFEFMLFNYFTDYSALYQEFSDEKLSLEGEWMKVI